MRTIATPEQGRAQLAKLGLALIACAAVHFAWVAFCMFGALLLGVVSFVPDLNELGAMMPVLSGAYVVIGLASFGVAVIQLAAGVRMRMGEGLYLGIVALAASILAMVFALYCSPITLAVLVYGVVVYVSPGVQALFAARTA